MPDSYDALPGRWTAYLISICESSKRAVAKGVVMAHLQYLLHTKYVANLCP